MQQIVIQLFNGVVWGLIFALIALGLTLIFGHLRVINMAHGVLYMLGAVFAWYLVTVLGSFWIGIVVAPLAVAAVGFILDRSLLNRIIGHKADVGVLATAGVLLIVQSIVLGVFGGGTQALAVPTRLGGSVVLFGFSYPTYRIVVAAISCAAMIAIAVLLKYTRIGLWMRAAPQSPELAAAIGMPAARVNTVTVVIGAYMAGLAGVLAAPIVSVNYQMGSAILATAFIVVVVGGLGSLTGAIIVAMIIGIAKGAFVVVVSPGWAGIISLVVLIPLMFLRPAGIFGGRR